MDEFMPDGMLFTLYFRLFKDLQNILFQRKN